MRTYHLKKFQGIDLRNLDEVGDPTAFRESVNVDLTTGGGFKARDQLRLWGTADQQSAGLYVANGALRAAYPLRRGSVASPPPLGMVYDYIGNTADGYNNTYNLEDVTSSGAWFGVPYIVAKHTNPQTNLPVYEHHYLGLTEGTFGGLAHTSGSSTTLILSAPLSTPQMTAVIGATINFTTVTSTIIYPVTVVSVTDSTHIVMDYARTVPVGTTALFLSPTDNRVVLPFEPGPAMLVHANRVWAGAISDRSVWYSASNQPTNYLDPKDSGFLATATHIDGDQPINGLYVFKAQLAVFYRRNVQVWQVGEIDPNTFAMVDSIGGAGTDYPKSIANMMGDLVYFSQGGFRLLSAVITTGQLKDGDLGAKIQALTKALPLSTLPPLVALWSPSRAQYLCAAGTTVFVLTHSPLSQVSGWSTYKFPWVVSHMVELDSVVYIRRADTGEIYVFDPSAANEPGFTWTNRLTFSDFETEHYLKHFKFLVAHLRGSCNLDFLLDPSDLADTSDSITIENGHNDVSGNKIPMLFHGDLLSLRFSGAAPCQVDEIMLRFEVGNIV